MLLFSLFYLVFLLNLNGNINYSQNRNSNRKQKKGIFLYHPMKKKLFKLENRNQEEKKSVGQVDLGSDVQNQGNLNQSFQTTKKILKKIMQDQTKTCKNVQRKSNSRITRKQNSIYS